ncbi:TonB-dependent receptor [Dyadobacter sp. CY323]|uniref:SusC/RagA family TonB-linked outer membrane protein n=1 Tax=Dyadobacter sp. CY323 TaxID=2907302 RepID=UPI001F1CC0F4|nr:TonB-dependent receptor [Dyadobacter sp. CY323]MCE6991837.1 TonB-dependent receptor [Dyadobacter sp. CY323]
MRKFLQLFFLILSAGLVAISAKQALASSTEVALQVVKGQVLDAETSDPLPGVNVIIEGSTQGTSTNADGNYEISVPDGNAVLVFSFVGYEKQQASVGNRTVIDIKLAVDRKSLNEVIVVGYGIQKKSDLTGSVALVSNDEIKQLPVATLQEGLQGRVAGVQVSQVSGAPGANLTVRIRGSNSIQYGNDPLYVIDGFPINTGSSTGNVGAGSNFGQNQGTSPLAFINPDDIESMTVLKDASATAIYGARGANGVVIVTTKKGKAGKTQINYDMYYGAQQVLRKLPMLNAPDWARLDREFWAVFRKGSLISRAYTPEQIAQMDEGTDWQDAIFRTAPIQNHNLSISGGNEKTRFSLSGNYFDQQGIVINSRFRKGSLSLNLEHNASERFKIGTSIIASYIQDNAIPHTNTSQDEPSVIYAALAMVPTLPVRNPDGTYSSQDKVWTTTGIYATPSTQNPVEVAERMKYRKTNNRILSNFYAQYNLAKGLTAKVTLGADISNVRLNTFIPSDFVISRGTGGEASMGTNQILNWVNENTLNYTTSLGEDHHFSALAGFTVQREKAESFSTSSQGFFTNITGYDNIGLGSAPQFPSSNTSRWSLVSFLGRVNYDYQSKYLVTASARYDGSSRFGSNHRFGFFPSMALAWRVSQEDFLKDNNWITDLKLRTSYGRTGNQDIPLYRNVQTYGQTSQYNFGSSFVTSIAPGSIVNQDMKWESTDQVDAGIDISLFGNRLTIVADYYYKVTKDLLFNVAIPRQGGFTSALMNIGSVRNKGLELGASWKVLDKAVKWDLSGNISFNRNKVLRLADADRFFGPVVSSYLLRNNGGAATIVKKGEPLGVFWGNIFDGLWQTQEDYNAGHMAKNLNSGPGFENYRDVDGNGVFEEGLDETVVGDPNPDYEFGVNSLLTYKGLELSLFVNGVQGNDILNLNLIDLTTQVNGKNGLDVYRNAWTGPGTSNTIAKIDRPDGRNGGFPNRVSSNYIEDGSFVSLRNVTLAYNIPLAKLKAFNKLRVYVAGENLVMLTKYSGFSPIRGIDLNNYPLARTYRVGLQLGF